MYVCDAMRDLVPFVQFKKHEKHPWRSVTFSCSLTLLTFLKFTNGTKSRKTSHSCVCFICKWMGDSSSLQLMGGSSYL